jgi:chromosomal replication initiator protein
VITTEITRNPGALSDEHWQNICGRARSDFGATAFNSWIAPLSVERVDQCTVRLSAPNRMHRDWVANHYASRLRAFWMSEDRSVNALEIVVGETNPPGVMVSTAERPIAPAELASAPTVRRGMPTVDGDGDRFVSAPLDPRFTFEDFVVGNPNELAHAASRRVAEAVCAREAAPFNPLFLYGGVGLGKTHLMHAIAWHIRRNAPSRRVIYLSAEQFMYEFVRALRYHNTVTFKELFRSVDVLMIDDLQFIAGKEQTQEEFFHTFNALVENNRQIIVSADKPPQNLENIEERMKSRLGWGMVADIHPTTYELRLGILQSKVERRQTQIAPKVLEFLAHKITSNVRELEGALTRIAAHADLVGRTITLESVQDVLRDLLRSNERIVTIEEIQKHVAEHFRIRLADMFSARRARAVARPRQVAMYLCKQLTPRSLPEIGRKFGGRDHTTVIHAVRKIEELMVTDRTLNEDIELLRRMLSGRESM